MNKTTLDLSTLSDISDGTHTVKVKAKADGYRDSEFSNEVSYTKAPATYSGKFTTYTNDSTSLGKTVTVKYKEAKYELTPFAQYEVLEQQLNVKPGDAIGWSISGDGRIHVISSKNCTVTVDEDKYGYAKPTGANWQVSTSFYYY